MGQNADEYSLLYAAETFKQFEELLRFFEKTVQRGKRYLTGRVSQRTGDF